MIFILATALVLLCALLLGLGQLLKSKHPLNCRRCGNPEKKECTVCHNKKKANPRGDNPRKKQ